ncbi:hypothetical protein PSH03_005405 [Micromonospora sp. PSH03]|uniref:hypothetical protein n=1 Tax=Micromonospora salmantinae TaxID=2911211 RepID=UPI001EE98A65|nr:hypothetical protein [Micromonospora salmantinae]MCG5459621.1 hypothetical protein [Micromonospora salmantinae]
MGDTRTLRVVVAGDGKGAETAVRRVGDSIEELDKNTKVADKTWDQFNYRVKSLGTVFKKTGEAAEASIKAADTTRLDEQLVTVYDRVVELNKKFAETGERDVFKKLRDDKRLLTQLRNVRLELAKTDGTLEGLSKSGGKFGMALGVAAGEAATKGLGASFNTLPPQAQAGIVAGVIALGGAVAPLLGGVIAGAIVGGVGIGGVIGGVAIAARHPAVKQEATYLATAFAQTMERAGSAFVPETMKALRKITNEVRSLDGDFQRIFAQAARYVEPLTDGVIGFVRNLLPGVESIIGKAGPVIDELASWGPRLGTLLSDVLTMFAENAHNGARALAMLWTIFEWGIRILAGSIDTLATTYGWFEKLGAVATGNVSKLAALSAAEVQSEQKTDGLGTSLQDVVSTLGAFTSGATEAAKPVETLAQQMNRLADENLNARSSVRAAKEAVDNASAALKRNGATLDTNTAKGRANEAALDEIARSYRAASEATLKQTGSQQQANVVLDSGRAKFIALADKMGLSAGKAKQLADRLFGIPNVNRNVTVAQAKALANIRAVQQNLAKIKSKNITIGVYYKTNGDLKVPGGTLLKNADGGLIRGPGTGTSDSVISRLSNGEYVLRAAAVRKLGVGFLNTLNYADRPGSVTTGFAAATVARMSAAGADLATTGGGSEGSGGVAVQVTVHVGGHVTTERNLAKAIALTVRDEIARNGYRNGGKTGL